MQRILENIAIFIVTLFFLPLVFNTMDDAVNETLGREKICSTDNSRITIEVVDNGLFGGTISYYYTDTNEKIEQLADAIDHGDEKFIDAGEKIAIDKIERYKVKNIKTCITQPKKENNK